MSSLGIAVYVPITGDAPEGSIVSLTGKGYALATEPYEIGLFGVVNNNPTIVFNGGNETNQKAVITSGQAAVRVSTANGAIKKGDWVTSSKIAGVGQKADQSGYIIGIAMEDYNASSPTQVGTIAVSLNFHLAMQPGTIKSNLLEALRTGSSATFLSPLISLRYLLAALVVLVAFIIGFMSFGRVAAKGVEALGRNPLASKLITVNIIFNLGLTILVIGAGIGLAALILLI